MSEALGFHNDNTYFISATTHPKKLQNIYSSSNKFQTCTMRTRQNAIIVLSFSHFMIISLLPQYIKHWFFAQEVPQQIREKPSTVPCKRISNSQNNDLVHQRPIRKPLFYFRKLKYTQWPNILRTYKTCTHPHQIAIKA